MDVPFFLDVESSGIARGSFPIEIGWAFAHADDATLEAHSLLIRPDDSWLARDGAWDGAAVRVHGLTLERLMDEGLPISEACERLDAAFAGRVLASDTGAGSWDDDWLLALYEAAGRDRGWDLAERPSGNHVARRLTALGLVPVTVRPALAPHAPPHTHAAAEDALVFAWEYAMSGLLGGRLAAGVAMAELLEGLADLPALIPREQWPRATASSFRRRHGGAGSARASLRV